jgi:polyisoprenoid-binding protein YceI
MLFASFMAVTTGMMAQDTQTVEIHLDPAATTVQWTLKSLPHNVHGTFKLKGGDIVVNPDTGLAQGEVLIDATSGTSGNAGRDAKWQKEVLESATYPAIIFHPNKIEGLKAADGTQQVKASGTMTLHGQDHAIELTLAVQVKGHDVTMTTHFMVPYVQWGLKQASSGLIRYDKQVAINVTAKGELVKQKATPSASPAADSQ